MEDAGWQGTEQDGARSFDLSRRNNPMIQGRSSTTKRDPSRGHIETHFAQIPIAQVVGLVDRATEQVRKQVEFPQSHLGHSATGKVLGAQKAQKAKRAQPNTQEGEARGACSGFMRDDKTMHAQTTRSGICPGGYVPVVHW